MPSNKKLVYIFIAVSIVYPLIVFNGIIDDFSPKHILEIEKISNRSHLDQNNFMTNQAPGFYALGSCIKLISNISSIEFLIYPLQLLPFLIIFYAFALKLSNSPVFSSVISCLYICSGTTGTAKIFFWIHGLGSIVYFTTLLLILSIMLAPSHKRSEFSFLLVTCGCSLAFLSYDLYSTLVIFLFYFIITTWFIGRKTTKLNFLTNKNFLNFYLILLITQLGLSRFVYDTFIPTLKATSDLEISVIDKFLSAYIYTKPNSEISVISELLINFPRIITIISLLKYLILCFSVILFIFLLIKKLEKNIELSVFDMFLVSYLMYICTSFLIRSYLGGIDITSIFLPGIFCIVWLYHTSNKYKYWAKFAIILILILTPAYTGIIESYGLRNPSISESEYLKTSSYWYFEHREDIIGVSDEMSKNLMSMFTFEKYNQSSKIDILSVNDAGFLVNKLNSESSKKYYLINYNLRSMSLQNWITIKTWRLFENSVDSNKHIFKIYDLDSISIYY